MTEDEMVRLRNLLGSAVKFSNLTQREIERKLGLSSGSLSRLFSGGIELKIKHILDVCRVIDFPPSRFFHAAYPEPDEPSGDAWRIQRLLEQLHPDRQGDEPKQTQEDATAVPAKPTQTEVEQMVLAALARLFTSARPEV